MQVTRHYFPGNNTPLGFFSYYRYILSQREANKIVCIKGGPGTGKSSFMQTIGDRLTAEGYSIDFLHCSANPDSLDGIILKDKKIAFVDGTSPHIIDPVTPGAVDSIINFGDFWNEDGFQYQKDEIIMNNEECSKWYGIAYNYLGAAKCVYDNLAQLNAEGMEISEIYKLSSDIINREYRDYDISYKSGRIKKFFATGITPDGTVSYIKTLLDNIDKVYLVNTPDGYDNSSFMSIVMEGALYRGFDIECFYCPIDPEKKIEHIVIPDLSLAFVTTNKWHDVEAWELSATDITLIDLCDYKDSSYIEKNKPIINKNICIFDFLLSKSIEALKNAKNKHDYVEKKYIPNMNFEKINDLVEKTIIDIV